MALLRLADPSQFDPLRHCGHRSVTDMLPEEEIASFLAFQLADGNILQTHEIEEAMDELEITKGFAFKRTALYLSLDNKR